MGQRRAAGGSRSSTYTRASWTPPRIAGAPSVSDRDAPIQVGTDVHAMANDMVAAVTKEVAQQFEHHIVPFFDAVRKEWPQPGNARWATGFSVKHLGVRTVAQGDTYAVSIVNAAFYAGFIKQKLHGNQRVRDRVLFDPGQKMAEALAHAIADHLGD